MVTFIIVEIDMTAIRELTNSRKKLSAELKAGRLKICRYFEKKICQRKKLTNFAYKNVSQS